MHRRTLVLCVAAAVAIAVLAGSQLATARTYARGPAAAPAACQLGANGKIKHVIYLQFDNVHFRRDNPNVPSDLEQMPHLLNFLKENGTFDTNDHTVLISHTGGGILSSLTGLYPDRHGQAVSNSYGYFRPDGSVGFSSTFKYWTDNTDGGNPANTPPTPSADTNYNMVNADPASLGGTGSVRNTPAPWVPYTRAGCDVGGVGVANMELENNNAIIFRSGSSSVFGTDPTGDMTKVFGEGSPEWNEGKASQLAPAGTADRAKAQTDFVGIAIHCAAGGGICNQNTANARPDLLPDEAPPEGGGVGGYNGFKALFGAKYVDPAINHGSASVGDVVDKRPITDPFGQPGFPGFDGMLAKNTLGYVAQMQEAGVPVTFGYISDAHDFHGVSGNTHVAFGPGEVGYVQQLRDYDQAFADFFARLQKDGITKDNSLFVVTVEEGDHFAGTPPDDPSCDGVHVACTYANGHVTEVNGDLKRLVATYNATHGTSATTNFSVHADMAPNVYITGNPAPDSTTARDLEKAMSDMTVKNPLSGATQKLFVAMADPVEEKLLHMVTADPARTPSFTPFAAGDYFLSAAGGTPTACTNASGQPDLSSCVFLPNTSPPNQTFAWNHGGVQPEVRSTWIGWVGPGVAHRGETDKVWTDHTDIRPTMLELLGLKDSYVSDGRVVTEFLQNNRLPRSLDGGKIDDLGAAYKQINASFGQFSLDTLAASTGALASATSGDTVYADTEAKLAQLGSDRDDLAAQIRLALWNAEFNDQKIDNKQAKDWIDAANDLLARAHALAASFESEENNAKQLGKIDHFVVIYEENHSFDNLFGGWEGVNGLADADQAHTIQVQQDAARTPLPCLPQDDVNLQHPLVKDSCTANPNQFRNAPFQIDDYLAPTDLSCPPSPAVAFTHPNGWPKDPSNPDHGAPGGCTRDIVHRFYEELYQLDGGRQDRYVIGSDAAGLVMGTYDTTQLPIYKYLHEKHHPDYAIEDNFFQAAFGGSFLNHQWLIAAATPVDPLGAPGGPHAANHSVLDVNGMPVLRQPPASQLPTPLYVSPASGGLNDGQLTQVCPAPNNLACGNYVVNTSQPFAPPFGGGLQIPAQTAPTIGDRLTDAGIDWAWYAGGWNDAVAGHPDPLFQFHHQPFAYFANYGPGAPGRSHLQDETDFQSLAAGSTVDCRLLPVSFVKPIGEENEHPGYASEPIGNDHLVELVSSIENSACAKDTMVIVTYDEFGGQWDHVPPPGQGNDNGPHDVWGPGTRIPALVIAPHLKGGFVVDSAEHDTTSILSTLEHRYGLAPLGTRDAAVNDLGTVFDSKKSKANR